MTLEGANNAMKRRGKKIMGEVSILERLQNIRAMLVEVRNSLGEDSPAEYEAPIEAVNDLITDVEAEAKAEAKAEVMEAVTTAEEQVEAKTEEPKAEEAPRRRGRPRKVQATSEDKEPAEKSEQTVVRRRAKKKSNENKELFPFYEQSLF